MHNIRQLLDSRGLYRILGSDGLFLVALLLFLISSAWIAISSLYPMAFDEEFHFGLIQIYSTSWFPFGIERTTDMAQYGAATADPSYLMHYLLSFPYRLLDWIGWSEQSIITALRLTNLSFVIVALVLYQKSIRIFTGSKAIANVAVIIFMLIPIVSFMSGQINYDNLLLLVVASCAYLTARIITHIERMDHIPVSEAWMLLIVLLAGVSVKYAYIPIGLSFLLCIALAVWKKRSHTSVASQITSFTRESMRLPKIKKTYIILALLLGLFFSFKFVVNYTEFGRPIPNCDIVFDDQACKAYGPWYRNTLLTAEKPDDFKPLSFPDYMTTFWIPDMSERLSFAVSGPTNDYDTKESLKYFVPLLHVLTVIGIICAAVSFKVIRKEPLFWISVLLLLLYIAPLAVRLYGSYRLTAEPVAINGRYLLPVLPLITATFIIGIRSVLRRLGANRIAPLLALFGIVTIILSGGGATTYTVLAEPEWFNAGFGQESHRVLQQLFSSFVIR